MRYGKTLDVHVPAKQLDLQRDNGLADPDSCEDAAEDQRALIIPCVDREEEGKEQAEEQWAPVTMSA